MIKHIVFLKLNEKSEDNLQKIVTALRGLKEKIVEVEHLEVGVDFKHGPNSWDIALITHFADRDALAIYATHPDHLPVVDLIGDMCAQRAVVDFEV